MIDTMTNRDYFLLILGMPLGAAATGILSTFGFPISLAVVGIAGSCIGVSLFLATTDRRNEELKK